MNDQVCYLLPTPTVTQYGSNRGGGAGNDTGDYRMSLTSLAKSGVITPETWGEFAPAIARWELVMNCLGPDPTVVSSRTGNLTLSPKFVEWLMGAPEGWVTAVPVLSRRSDGHRSAALSLLGDGVVRQQGAEAFRRIFVELEKFDETKNLLERLTPG